ncbi:PTS fructose transporter subunit IIABC [Lacicoccus qingdaonensis]|uniref:PTS system D-fructose-specific IIA component (F1P-forming), Frc family /PTS system D-fructose-specific IIB component (F1P-forming), Frc family /PTS system D-fructose-specific IIC component (F1P-for... n=1 Tax=Lacicoccus qingdaonensis TaxID=576118 RepID=A0A1G9EU72_9BACL|nr:fructose-specific PTS transporter subunit EIIC [Salinicoccus qingdaonensis]SDK79631.1 PTS system D-fructose-specific IIA component (F1P-forming), Frc family /PTS system D-fructose-specific IIB component (F1P-forming), Frc family /PTS system D-fructose-specific IIC component (F1P-forming), Frc family [Salinicoccus qingdaonensis]
MRITELLTKETIKMNVEAKDKDAVIKELVNELDSAGIITDAGKFEAAIQKRESQSTTGVGDGIAIPHAQTEEVKKPAIMFGRSAEGIDYDSLDGQDAYLFFMIAAPDGQATTHLDALAKLSGILMNPDAKERLLKADSADEVLNTIDHYDESEPSEDTAETVVSNEDRPYIVAVTACPTGIAHTYMAADALKNKAKEMNVDIKVETNGSGGVKEPLSEADIEKASGVIVAADTKVEMARFNGKRLLEVPVSDGIKRPEALIQSTLDGQGEVYEGSDGGSSQSSSSKGKPSIYKHLMNGVSNMLPFVVAGGILIAISFFWGIESANPDHADYSPIAEMINFIGSNAFELMVPILAGFIAMSIADRPGFAPGMVGGLMAATMGSGFLGGLVAGFLAGYLMVAIKKLTEKFPQALDGLKPVLIYPLLGVFLTGVIMYYIIDPPATALNEALNSFLENLSGTNIVILGAILGGMMAIDMGGPINKAAYAFSIATLTAGNPEPITAAMIGGMVPPLAIALATVVFRNKFTPVERSSGPTNLVMGLSFITEGAIPFAAADPLRVIPSMMVGSAVAGAMALGLGATIPAPHGGIFVAGVGDNVLMFLLALLVGTIVSAILLGVLKRKEQI